MNNFPKNSRRGFLLIEILIYLFLFSVIIIGSLEAFFTFIDNNQKLSQENLILEEAEFAMKKMKNFISLSESVVEPLGNQSQKLVLIMPNPSESPAGFELENGQLILEAGNSEPARINNERIAVNNLIFKRVTYENNPAVFGIEISFEINGRHFKAFKTKHVEQ